jgi:hypothetical protein
MTTIIYHINEVPNVTSTTRYNHAVGLAEGHQSSLLLTHAVPPEPVAEAYTRVEHLDATTPFGRIHQAVEVVNEVVRSSPDVRLVTTAQFEPVVTGRVARAAWTVDLYDDPLQGIRNDPLSIHHVTVRLKSGLVASAQRGVNTVHRDAPNQAGVDREYCINGAPTGTVTPRTPELSPPLRLVVAGKAMLGKGMGLVLDGLREYDADVRVDAYGTVDAETVEYARSAGVDDRVTFHGRTPHPDVLDAVADAHGGLCVLPPREDWKYHYPIKMGEYLAGATVPVASDFPGLREMGGAAAVYVDPSTEGVAEGLERLSSMTHNEYRRRADEARARGEEIRWSRVRRDFARKVSLPSADNA